MQVEQHFLRDFNELAQLLREQGRLGLFTIELIGSVDLSEHSTAPKLEVHIRHYHYSKFNTQQEVKGVQIRECFDQLQRDLRRDDTLLCLPAPKAE